jgi:hypothetical protein
VKIQNGRATVTVRPDGRRLSPLGREILERITMTSSEARKSRASEIDLSATGAVVWLTATAFLALLVLYFIGVDQGATSVFGPDNMYVHEFVHDARHLLGFPCH